jgi:kynurenine formamidase
MSTSAIDLGAVMAMAHKYRNWGRWGPDDQLGTMNCVTSEKIVRAAALVKRGKVFSLALPFDASGPQNGATFGRVNPQHIMLQDGGDVASGAQDNLAVLRYTDDAVYMPLQCGTQWDALAHIYCDGQMYNGYGPDAVSSTGATKNSITQIGDRAVGRGVLLDIARHRGKPWLDPGEGISSDDLELCARGAGIEVAEGDFVLIRTGQLAQVRERGSWGDYVGGSAPGLTISAADFFCPRNVAAVATDTWGVEVLPNETAAVFQPLHIIMLVNAGIHLGEMLDLEDLARDCAEDGVHEFLFVAPPLPITGAVGSPINPQAIK